MNILLVPDKFKGSLSAKQVIAALRKGISKYDDSFHVHHVVASDGGDGFLDAIGENIEIKFINVKSVDPLGRELSCFYGLDIANKTAYIELARTSGITLLKGEERNPLRTSTFGTGLQIRHALNKGVKKIYIGLGGSATNDGGIGIASALGFQFLNGNNNDLKPIGENLNQIVKIIPPSNKEFKNVKFCAVNDVINPLCGENGAAFVYGKQKGANKRAIELLDKGLLNLHNMVYKYMGADVAKVPGTGSAGGAAYGLKVFFNADFVEGTEFILNRNKEIDFLKNGEIDLIITGEGMIDDQTIQGKLVSGVSFMAKKYNTKAIAICGKKKLIHTNNESLGLTEIIEIADPSRSLAYNMENADLLIQKSIFDYFKKNY